MFKNKLEFQINNRLTDNFELLQTLESFLSKPWQAPSQSILFKADCSTGKTFTFLNMLGNKNQRKKPFSHLTRNLDAFNILAVPTLVQVKQVEQEYGIKGIYGGTGIPDLHKHNTVVVVYDMVEQVYKKAVNNFGMHRVDLIIDEAHELADAATYRENAVNGIMRTVDRIKSGNHGNVIFMSGTPDSILPLDFDLCIEAVPVEAGLISKAVIKEVMPTDGMTMRDSVLYLIKEKIDLGYVPVIQHDSKKTIQYFMDRLSIMGYNAASISSDDNRNVITHADGTQECCNKVFETIIKQGIVPTKIKGKQYDVIFTTSVINSGTNITGTDRECKGLLPMYYVSDEEKMSFSKIVQFMNRFRKNKGSVLLVMPAVGKPHSPYRTVDELQKELYDAVYESYNSFVNMPEYLSGVPVFRYSAGQKDSSAKQCIAEAMDSLLSYEGADGMTGSVDGIITYDAETMQVRTDMLKFCHVLSGMKDKELYYHRKELSSELAKALRTTCVIKGPDRNRPGSGSGNSKELKKQIKEQHRQEDMAFASKMALDPEQSRIRFRSNAFDETMAEARSAGTESFNKLREIAIGGTKEEYNKAVTALAQGDTKTGDAVRMDVLKNLAKNKDVASCAIEKISHGKNVTWTEADTRAAADILTGDPEYRKYIKDSLRTGINPGTVMNNMARYDIDELIEKTESMAVRMRNAKYLAGVRTDNAGLLHEATISALAEKKDGRLVQRKLNKEKLTSALEALRKAFPKKRLSLNKLVKSVKEIFTIRDNYGDYDFTITGLRLDARFAPMPSEA